MYIYIEAYTYIHLIGELDTITIERLEAVLVQIATFRSANTLGTH